MFRCGLGLVLTVAAPLIGGCGSLPSGDHWGEGAIWPVSGQRIVKAAKDALLDPQTWVPAAGAFVFAIDDWGHKASDWATEHTPIFGSQEDARKASDDLLWISSAEVMVTVLATPGGDAPQEWVIAKAKDLTVGFGTLGVNGLTGELLKGAVGRDRPNGGVGTSFPSGAQLGGFCCGHPFQQQPRLHRHAQRHPPGLPDQQPGPDQRCGLGPSRGQGPLSFRCPGRCCPGASPHGLHLRCLHGPSWEQPHRRRDHAPGWRRSLKRGLSLLTERPGYSTSVQACPR